jgi:PD-(D/E)XK endonuclease
MNSNRKGNIAEAEIAAAAIRLGIQVLKPLVEHSRYDLVFDLPAGLLRVQCKWAPRRSGAVVVELTGFRYTANGCVRSVYAADEIDAVAVYCQNVDRCYLLPIELVDGKRSLSLRLAPAKNGQRAALHWAADYELGAIAQLGERLSGTQEGAGSSPASSTPPGAVEEVGAHEFRNLFGWYMQRATAGETFLVKRRGKPWVRLGPATEPLTVVPLPEKKAA